MDLQQRRSHHLARRVGPRSRRFRKRPARRLHGRTHRLDSGPQRQPRHTHALRSRYAENSFAIENAAPAASPPISVVRNALFHGDTPVKRPFTNPNTASATIVAITE